MYGNIYSNKQRRSIVLNLLFPGTVIERSGQDADSFLLGIFAVTKGLMLAQVREITGLDTSAIQNWVNRGWVQKPVDKRYSVDHLARIMIINMLRDVMKLENIAALLTYINGEAGNTSDDVMKESELYCHLCKILDNINFETVLTETELDNIVQQEIDGYIEPFPGARKRLVEGIKIILIYFASSIIKKRADILYKEVLDN